MIPKQVEEALKIKTERKSEKESEWKREKVRKTGGKRERGGGGVCV